MMFLFAQFSFLGTGMVMAREHKDESQAKLATVLSIAIAVVWITLFGIWLGILYGGSIEKGLVVTFSVLVAVATLFNATLAYLHGLYHGGMMSSPLKESSPSDDVQKYALTQKGLPTLAAGAFVAMTALYINNTVLVNQFDISILNTTSNSSAAEYVENDWKIVEMTDEWRNLGQVIAQFALLCFGLVAGGVRQDENKTYDKQRNMFILIVAVAWIGVVIGESLFESEDDSSHNDYYTMDITMGSLYLVFSAIILIVIGRLQRLGTGTEVGGHYQMMRTNANYL